MWTCVSLCPSARNRHPESTREWCSKPLQFLDLTAGFKTSCGHNRAAGTAPAGEGKSTEAFEKELKDFLDEDGNRRITSVSEVQIPEVIQDSRFAERFESAHSFDGMFCSVDCLSSITPGGHLSLS